MSKERWELPAECEGVVGQLDLEDQITQYRIIDDTIYVRQTNCHVVSPTTTYQMMASTEPLTFRHHNDPIPVPEPDATAALLVLLVAIVFLWRVGPLR